MGVLSLYIYMYMQLHACIYIYIYIYIYIHMTIMSKAPLWTILTTSRAVVLAYMYAYVYVLRILWNEFKGERAVHLISRHISSKTIGARVASISKVRLATWNSIPSAISEFSGRIHLIFRIIWTFAQRWYNCHGKPKAAFNKPRSAILQV